MKCQIIELLQSLKEMVDVIGKDEIKYKNFSADCKMVVDYLAVVLSDYECAKSEITALVDLFNMQFDDYALEQKNVKRICINLSRVVAYEIQTRWRMFFMPYKHSMWHSMESIYDTAVKDPRCDVFVMPIPYKTLNIDGTVMQQHCEIDKFTNIETVSYKETDIEGIHPEFIFIHNAYDNYNNLTRVEERFYSSNLNKCTENLVYTPYYTYFDSSKTACDRLILQQGIINADYIIAQSIQVKKEYIKRGFSDKKIIAKGSPKIDKIVNLMKNPPQMPKEWREKLEGRKVVLYTFPLEACVNREWLSAILNCMKTYWNDSDIALIFRPHPMVYSYAKGRGVNLDLLEEIFSFAKTGERIVMDTNSDISYAYSCSDSLMLSGTSSIINEYLATGKPIYFDLLNFDKAEASSQIFIDLSANYCPQHREGEDILEAHNRGVEDFFKVTKGELEDTKKAARQKSFADGFINCDASAGEKIYEELISKLT